MSTRGTRAPHPLPARLCAARTHARTHARTRRPTALTPPVFPPFYRTRSAEEAPPRPRAERAPPPPQPQEPAFGFNPAFVGRGGANFQAYLGFPFFSFAMNVGGPRQNGRRLTPDEQRELYISNGFLALGLVFLLAFIFLL